MKYYITLLFLVFYLNSTAQENETFLIGNWKVVDLSLSEDATPEQKRIFKTVGPDLLKFVFKLEAGRKGKFKTPFENKGHSPPEDIYWTYSPTRKHVIISDWKDRQSRLIKFYVKVEGGSTYFIPDEFPVVLKVTKT